MTDSFNASGTFDNGVFKAYGDEVKPETAEPLEEMTAQEVLEAVDSGEVSKAEALAAEKKRSTPRKTVSEGL